MSLCIEGRLRTPVIAWLREQGMFPVFEVYLGGGLCDIVGVEFNQRTNRRIPAIRQSCAIELKMEDAAGVLYQAAGNRNVAMRSYAAMPEYRVSRMQPATLDKFRAAGVGLMSIAVRDDGTESLRIVIDAVAGDGNHAALMKVWRRRDEWKTRVSQTRVAQLKAMRKH